MENDRLIIKKTEETPAIIFIPEKGMFQIIGTSWPENAKDFYEPVIKFLENYFRYPNKETIVDFKLEYFNTASSKQIARILSLLKEKSQYHNIKIKWHHQKEDFDINKEGRRFAEVLGINIEFVPY